MIARAVAEEAEDIEMGRVVVEVAVLEVAVDVDPRPVAAVAEVAVTGIAAATEAAGIVEISPETEEVDRSRAKDCEGFVGMMLI